MIIKSLQLHNYRRYKDAIIEFPSGLLGIVGKNGAGKSSLIESIGWCLYGNSASRTDKEGIKRTSCEVTEDCKVVLEMMLGDDLIRIERELRGRNSQGYASLFLNSNTRPQVTGAVDVTDYITRRTGMDHVAFFTSVFAKQKELNALSDLQPAKRKETILRLLRIDKIDLVIANIRADIRQSQDRIYFIKSTLKDIDQLILDGQNLANESITKTSEIDSTDKEIILLEKSVKEEKKKFKIQETKYREHNKVSSKGNTLDERRKGKISQKSREESELSDAEKSKEEYNKLQPSLAEYKKIQKEKDVIDSILPKFKTKLGFEKRLIEINSNLTKHNKSKTELSAQLAKHKKLDAEFKINSKKILVEEKRQGTTEASINQLKAGLKNLASNKRKIQAEFSKIKGLGKKGDCPTCKRVLGNHLPTITAHFQQEIKKIDDEAKKLDALKQKHDQNLKLILSNMESLEDQEETIREKQTERTRLQARLKETIKILLSEQKNLIKTTASLKKFANISYDKSRHDKVRSEFSRLSKINSQCISLKRDIQRIPKLQSSITILTKSITKLDSDIEKNKKSIQKIGYDESEYEQSRMSLDSATESHQQKREIAIQQRADLQQIKTRIDQNNQTIVEEKEKRDIVEVEEKTIGSRSKLDKIMVDFKIDLISRIRPMLSSRATDLFRQITNGKYASMELDEDYNIKIEDEGETFGVERFSGGEEDLANLCLRIAISQELSERAGGVRANFIALDEIFGSQDADRKGSILKALTQLSSQFRQIILITHIEDIKESLPYVLHVKDDSDGTVKIETEGIVSAVA